MRPVVDMISDICSFKVYSFQIIVFLKALLSTTNSAKISNFNRTQDYKHLLFIEIGITEKQIEDNFQNIFKPCSLPVSY